MSEFDKVIGYDDIVIELKRYCDTLKNSEKYMKLGVTLPSGILLYGDPGVGKTLMSKCFVTESGCRVITLRKDEPNGDFVNKIKATFDEAKKGGTTIVFLDDMDKYANEDTMHRDAEEYVAIQSCIDECRGEGVFVLATVNDKYCLPDSLLRAGRFDKVIEVRVPKGKDAERVIRHFLSEKQMLGDVDVEEITRLLEGKSCAELETVINEAGIYAGYENRGRIYQSDVVKACMRMIFESPECISSDEDGNTECVAVHEAGHAVVAEMLDPGSVTLISVCRHIGSVEGVTKVRRPKGYRVSKELQEHEVMCGLAGKAALDVVYGMPDMGCEADMHKVFDKVSEFVDNNCTIGFDTFERENPSQCLLEKKDMLIAAEVDRYYLSTKRIITENREFLDNIKEALMDHNTVTYREIQYLKEGFTNSVSTPFD